MEILAVLVLPLRNKLDFCGPVDDTTRAVWGHGCLQVFCLFDFFPKIGVGLQSSIITALLTFFQITKTILQVGEKQSVFYLGRTTPLIICFVSFKKRKNNLLTHFFCIIEYLENLSVLSTERFLQNRFQFANSLQSP